MGFLEILKGDSDSNFFNNFTKEHVFVKTRIQLNFRTANLDYFSFLLKKNSLYTVKILNSIATS